MLVLANLHLILFDFVGTHTTCCTCTTLVFKWWASGVVQCWMMTSLTATTPDHATCGTDDYGYLTACTTTSCPPPPRPPISLSPSNPPLSPCCQVNRATHLSGLVTHRTAQHMLCLTLYILHSLQAHFCCVFGTAWLPSRPPCHYAVASHNQVFSR